MTQRSTKGASKQRRDAINERVGQIRDALPLSEVTRSRLSQLQVMALARAFIGKSKFFTSCFSEADDRSATWCEYFDFIQAMPGFLMIIGLDGRILYISDNICDYLGNSSVDTMTQTESVYDLIDARDQYVLRQVMNARAMDGDGLPDSKLSFSCRMNTSVRNIRYVAAPTKTGFERYRTIHVKGRFVRSHHLSSIYGVEQQACNIAFVAFCSPRLSFTDTLSPVDGGAAVGDSTVFRSVHGPDMKFVSVDSNGEFYLGVGRDAICGKSWYEIIHPDDMHDAQLKHIELMRAIEIGDLSACRSLCVRVQSRNGDVMWLHVIMSSCSSDEMAFDDVISWQHPGAMRRPKSMIICINRVVDDEEAMSIRMGELIDDVEQATSAAAPSRTGSSTVAGSEMGADDDIDTDLLIEQLGFSKTGNSSISGRQPMQVNGYQQRQQASKRTAESNGFVEGAASTKIRRTNEFVTSDNSAFCRSMPSPPFQQYDVPETDFSSQFSSFHGPFLGSGDFKSSASVNGSSFGSKCMSSDGSKCTSSDGLFQFGELKSEPIIIDDRASPLIPESFLTPQSSPASSRRSTQSPPQTAYPYDTYQAHSPVHTVPEAHFDDSLRTATHPVNLAMPREMSMFDDFLATGAARKPEVMATPVNSYSTQAGTDRILIDSSYLPELDESVLAFLEPGQAAAFGQQGQTVPRGHQVEEDRWWSREDNLIHSMLQIGGEFMSSYASRPGDVIDMRSRAHHTSQQWPTASLSY